MPIRIDVKQDGLIPGISKSGIRKLKTAGLLYIAQRWHQLYSDAKFTPAAARKYNYRVRRTKEIRIGKIKKGVRRKYRGFPISGNPLVWSGRTRTIAKSPAFTANSKRSYAKVRASTLNRKPPGFPSGQMRFEYTRVLPSEEKVLAKEAEGGMRSQFSKRKRNISVQSFRN